jgi:hypothetical protein
VKSPLKRAGKKPPQVPESSGTLNGPFRRTFSLTEQNLPDTVVADWIACFMLPRQGGKKNATSSGLKTHGRTVITGLSLN